MPRLGPINPGKTSYPLYRRLVVPHDRSGRVWKIWLPLGFDLPTVLPIASSFTDCILYEGRL